jgi:two-component system, OmpR family, sensor histidine kinase KdpD
VRSIAAWLTRHGYVLAVLAIVVSTLLFLPGRDTFAKGQWALLYLLIVVLVAGASGVGPAMLASLLAFLAWNFFFLPPYHTFAVHDPKDWLSLVAFLAVGVIMGIQTGRMREREARARRLQAAATQAEALREADRLKSSLLSSVSHELKTPLAALTATVSNLLEKDVAWDEQNVRDELQAILADVRRLTNSINALLDLSRLEAHTWEPQRDEYDLSDIVAESLDTLTPAQRQRVTVALPDDLPPLDVDHAQWVRVVTNLVENAVLYSGADARVRVEARVDGSGTTTLCVEDDGPGIAPGELEAVFDKFFRGSAAHADAPSGTGLGLAIAREIVRAHGGTIAAQPVTPHGARFVVTLPAHTEPAGGGAGRETTTAVTPDSAAALGRTAAGGRT